MKKLIIAFFFTTYLFLPTISFAQKTLLDSLDQMNEIADKIIHEHRESKKPIKHDQSFDTQPNSEYNFTVDDILGPSLNSDPVVQEAKAEQALRESQNTLSSTSIIPSTIQYLNTSNQKEYWPASICLLIGIIIWYYWAREYNRGLKDPMNSRRIYDSPFGCLPWLVAFIFIGAGIYLLF